MRLAAPAAGMGWIVVFMFWTVQLLFMFAACWLPTSRPEAGGFTRLQRKKPPFVTGFFEEFIAGRGCLRAEVCEITSPCTAKQ
jgi:hypothetical protein